MYLNVCVGNFSFLKSIEKERRFMFIFLKFCIVSKNKFSNMRICFLVFLHIYIFKKKPDIEIQLPKEGAANSSETEI